jgi:hypothetical protein
VQKRFSIGRCFGVQGFRPPRASNWIDKFSALSYWQIDQMTERPSKIALHKRNSAFPLIAFSFSILPFGRVANFDYQWAIRRFPASTLTPARLATSPIRWPVLLTVGVYTLEQGPESSPTFAEPATQDQDTTPGFALGCLDRLCFLIREMSISSTV